MNARRGPQQPNRWQRLASFDETALQEVYRDTTLTARGVLTVLVVMAISSLGGFVWLAVLEDRVGDEVDFLIDSVLIGSLLATALFLVWGGLVGVFGGQLGRQDPQALAATVRTHAFASVPFGFSGLILIPGLEFTISVITLGLLLISTTQAARVSLGVSLGRALGANLFGFFIWLVVLTALTDRGDAYAPAIFFWSLFP